MHGKFSPEKFDDDSKLKCFRGLINAEDRVMLCIAMPYDAIKLRSIYASVASSVRIVWCLYFVSMF